MSEPKNTVVSKVQQHVGKLADNPSNAIAFLTVASTAAGMFKDTKLGSIATAVEKLAGHATMLHSLNQTIGAMNGGKNVLHIASEALAKHDDRFHAVANNIQTGLSSATGTALDKVKAGFSGLVSGAENVTEVAAAGKSPEPANNGQYQQQGNSRA